MEIYKKLFLLALMIIMLAGCSPSEEQQLATLTQVAAEIFATQTAEYSPPPTATYTETTTPTTTPSPTPIPLPDAVVLDLIEMREGPGSRYDYIDNLFEGDEPKVIGKNKKCVYLKVEDIKGQQGWIENNSSDIQLNLPCDQILFGTYQPQNGDRVTRFPLMLADIGKLKISNGTGSDAVLILTDERDNVVVGYYIHAGENYQIDHIPDGTYHVYFSTGSQWNGEAFTEDASYQKFDDSISFNTTSNQYTIWEITLQPVAGGQASTSGVDQEDFPSLGGE